MSRVITLSMGAVILVGAGVILSEGVTGTAPSVSIKQEQMSGGATTVRVDPAQLAMEAPTANQWAADYPKGSFSAPPRVKRARVKASDAKYAKHGAPTWDQWTKEYPSGDFPGGAIASRAPFVVGTRN